MKECRANMRIIGYLNYILLEYKSYFTNSGLILNYNYFLIGSDGGSVGAVFQNNSSGQFKNIKNNNSTDLHFDMKLRTSMYNYGSFLAYNGTITTE